MIDIWKAFVGMLISVLLTGLASWFSFGAGTATKAELLTLRQDISETTEKNERKIELTTKTVNSMAVILGRIETKLEAVSEDIHDLKQESR